MLVTYHYAKGDKHRGCRGFDYDVDAARAATASLKKKFDEVFGRGTVHAIQVGVETDNEGLVLHGDDGEVVDLAVFDLTHGNVLKLIERLYPDMASRVRLDLLPLVEGNIRHIAERQ